MFVTATQTGDNQFVIHMTGVTEGKLHAMRHALIMYSDKSVVAQDCMLALSRAMDDVGIELQDEKAVLEANGVRV